MNAANEQTLARNNSTHVTAGGKYAIPLGSSPMSKAHRDQSLRIQKDVDQIQLSNHQMSDMALSQTMAP